MEVELENTQTAKASVDLQHEKLLESEKALRNQLEIEQKEASAKIEQLREEMKTSKTLSAEELKSRTEELLSLEHRFRVRNSQLHLDRYSQLPNLFRP